MHRIDVVVASQPSLVLDEIFLRASTYPDSVLHVRSGNDCASSMDPK